MDSRPIKVSMAKQGRPCHSCAAQQGACSVLSQALVGASGAAAFPKGSQFPALQTSSRPRPRLASCSCQR